MQLENISMEYPERLLYILCLIYVCLVIDQCYSISVSTKKSSNIIKGVEHQKRGIQEIQNNFKEKCLFSPKQYNRNDVDDSIIENEDGLNYDENDDDQNDNEIGLEADTRQGLVRKQLEVDDDDATRLFPNKRKSQNNNYLNKQIKMNMKKKIKKINLNKEDYYEEESENEEEVTDGEIKVVNMWDSLPAAVIKKHRKLSQNLDDILKFRNNLGNLTDYMAGLKSLIIRIDEDNNSDNGSSFKNNTSHNLKNYTTNDLPNSKCVNLTNKVFEKQCYAINNLARGHENPHWNWKWMWNWNSDEENQPDIWTVPPIPEVTQIDNTPIEISTTEFEFPTQVSSISNFTYYCSTQESTTVISSCNISKHSDVLNANVNSSNTGDMLKQMLHLPQKKTTKERMISQTNFMKYEDHSLLSKFSNYYNYTIMPLIGSISTELYAQNYNATSKGILLIEDNDKVKSALPVTYKKISPLLNRMNDKHQENEQLYKIEDDEKTRKRSKYLKMRHNSAYLSKNNRSIQLQY